MFTSVPEIDDETIAQSNGISSLNLREWLDSSQLSPWSKEVLDSAQIVSKKIDEGHCVYSFEVDGSPGACFFLESDVQKLHDMMPFNLPSGQLYHNEVSAALLEYSVRKFFHMLKSVWTLTDHINIGTVARVLPSAFDGSPMECVRVRLRHDDDSLYHVYFALPDSVLSYAEEFAWPVLYWQADAHFKSLRSIYYKVVLCSIGIEPTSLIDLLSSGSILPIPEEVDFDDLRIESPDFGVIKAKLLKNDSQYWVAFTDGSPHSTDSFMDKTRVDIEIDSGEVPPEFFKDHPQLLPISQSGLPHVRLTVGGEEVAKGVIGSYRGELAIQIQG